MHHYTPEELRTGLEEVGVRSGRVVFSHVGLGLLGRPDGARDMADAGAILVDAMTGVLGSAGTWLVPTYTYSYCNGEVYDPAESPSTVGPFTEQFRGLPQARRSLDPIFSVAGMGQRVGELIDGLPRDCFGADSVHERLLHADAVICNVGVGVRYATFVHHIEEDVGVPYRYHKIFTGRTRLDGELREESWRYYVRVLDGSSVPDLTRLEAEADARGAVRRARVGRGELTCIDCRDLAELCRAGIARDPWYLASGPSS